MNYQSCLMKIVEYKNNRNVIVEFQDKYKAMTHTNYQAFLKGSVKNPYYPSVYGVGIIGNKYPTNIGGESTKEYESWRGMLRRCYDEKFKKTELTYKEAICCDEWLLFENFYEWLHSQFNFDKWYDNDGWAIDKDILVKGNKKYSPEVCCLVPQNVNSLFVKRDNYRGDLPLGISLNTGGNITRPYEASVFTSNKRKYIGIYETPEKGFYLGYKPEKETIIKQVAQEEYSKGNITKQCYEAMMNYEVEITD